VLGYTAHAMRAIHTTPRAAATPFRGLR
jgi:hypothetical protein